MKDIPEAFTFSAIIVCKDCGADAAVCVDFDTDNRIVEFTIDMECSACGCIARMPITPELLAEAQATP